jgi:hypothetical protein
MSPPCWGPRMQAIQTRNQREPCIKETSYIRKVVTIHKHRCNNLNPTESNIIFQWTTRSPKWCIFRFPTKILHAFLVLPISLELATRSGHLLLLDLPILISGEKYILSCPSRACRCWMLTFLTSALLGVESVCDMRRVIGHLDSKEDGCQRALQLNMGSYPRRNQKMFLLR